MAWAQGLVWTAEKERTRVLEGTSFTPITAT
jgi:hypothetical protein